MPKAVKKIPEAEKVKVKHVYITDNQELKIIKKYGSLTEAVRKKIVPACQ